MLNIIFKEGQGLGNQLWNFAVAKSLSEKLNVGLNIYDFRKFKGKGFLKLDNKNNFEYSINEYKFSKDIEIFNERTFYDYQLRYLSSDYDERLLNIKKETILEGIFQSESYFFGDLKKLKRYIKLNKKIKEENKIEKDICILNIRGGEYKRHKDFILPKDYWINAMKNYNIKFKICKFLIVTDDYRYAKSIFPKVKIIHGDIGKCYASIYNSSNLILSNSTFSYFPCKTGINKRIIAPMYWARPNNKYERWVSPCNIYEGWLWQDIKSNLKTYDECLKIANKTSDYYKKEFTVLIKPIDVPVNNILKIIPNNLKKIIKRVLSYLLPKHFG